MAEVTIYTSASCGFCYRAKRLLRANKIAFKEISVTFRPSVRRAMTERANGRTSVPQIFIGTYHIGGYDDLCALDAGGDLGAGLRGYGIAAAELP